MIRLYTFTISTVSPADKSIVFHIELSTYTLFRQAACIHRPFVFGPAIPVTSRTMT